MKKTLFALYVTLGTMPLLGSPTERIVFDNPTKEKIVFILSKEKSPVRKITLAAKSKKKLRVDDTFTSVTLKSVANPRNRSTQKVPYAHRQSLNLIGAIEGIGGNLSITFGSSK